jgi:hypothetical protein
VKEGDNSEDVAIDDSIILKWVVNEPGREDVAYIGFSCLICRMEHSVMLYLQNFNPKGIPIHSCHTSRNLVVLRRAVESESVKMYRLRLRPQSKILTRYSNSRALIATVTIRFILKYRL